MANDEEEGVDLEDMETEQPHVYNEMDAELTEEYESESETKRKL